MDFVSIRLITNQVNGLVSFYERVTNVTAVRYTEDFAEVRLPSCTLAIASTRTVPQPASRGIQPAQNHSAILEFRVEDVDSAFERLKSPLLDVVTEPTTMPWGNRSLLLRDPDGNLINLFTPVTPEAIRRFTKPKVTE